jgi:hypothetical protein
MNVYFRQTTKVRRLRDISANQALNPGCCSAQMAFATLKSKFRNFNSEVHKLAINEQGGANYDQAERSPGYIKISQEHCQKYFYLSGALSATTCKKRS